MKTTQRDQIRLATVTVIHGDKADSAKGFFVPGGFILTAAHCVPWNADGRMALGESLHVAIVTANERELTGEVIAVEPVADIAVIAAPDNQSFPEDAEAFDLFAESVNALRLCEAEFPFGEDFPIHILTHRGDWISGKAALWKENAPTMALETHPQIPPGTSGSAIVNEAGKVVGVVSAIHGEEAGGIGSCGRPCQALPVWLWRAIKAAETEAQR